MTVDSILLRDVCEYKKKQSQTTSKSCFATGSEQTKQITTEDEESVQKKLDIETVKEGELTKRREPMERYLERRKNPVA